MQGFREKQDYITNEISIFVAANVGRIIKNVMDMNHKEHVSMPSQERIGKAFRKMVEDKRAIRSYIRENGTLEGFKDETIIFAKPL